MSDQAEQLERLKAALADRYRLERELGRGGMATVYLAEDLKHHREIAIKVLNPELTQSVGADRFLREIQIAARLTHPNILMLIDSGEADGFLYYVMPYVAGESLRARLNREPQIPIGDALQITHEIADALELAHREGVVHRDIKPENILIESGRAIVTDFGVARAVTVAGGEKLTATGVAVGTPHYMSPEQATGSGPIDGRSDIYALGCLLYEMLGGEPPFTGPSAQAILARHAVDPVPNLRTLRTTVPEGLVKAIERALNKSPADRFASAADFSDALHIAATAPVVKKRRRTVPRTAALVFTGLAAVAAAASLVISRSEESSPVTIAPTRIAVFPFRVRGGADLEYLQEGLMDLVSDALDGAGDLRRVDPYALTADLKRAAVTIVGRDDANASAARFGAGHYVLGSAIDLGEQIRVSASLYALDGGPDPLTRSVTDGTPETVAALVEQLAAELITRLPAGAGVRLEDVRTVRTANYTALKAYLEGEALWRRGWPDSALIPLRRAVEADSTFALAWYRLSVAEGFGSWTRAAAAIEQAMQYRDRLSVRDQLLVELQYARRHGDGKRIEELGQEVTRLYPDHVEGWWGLGRGRVFYSWQVGKPFAAARAPLERALALEPDHPGAAWHAMFVAAIDRRHAEAASLLARAMRGGGANYYRASLPGILAYAQGDTSALADLTAELARRNSDVILGAAHMLIGFSDSMEAGIRLARLVFDEGRPEADRVHAHMQFAHFELARGRWEQAKNEFAAAARWAPDRAFVYQAWRAAMPFLKVPEAELSRLRDSLQIWPVPTDIPYARVPDALLPHIKHYLLGLVSARLGASDEAVRHAAALEQATSPPDPNGLRRDLALEIRALAATETGRFQEALSIIEGMELRTSALQDQFSPFNRRPLGRYLRAELLFAAGRNEEALGWHAAWHSWSFTPEGVWRSPAHRTMGKIAERLGEFETARRHYAAFIARWRDADPRLQPEVDAVKQRLNDLASERRR